MHSNMEIHPPRLFGSNLKTEELQTDLLSERLPLEVLWIKDVCGLGIFVYIS